MNKSLIFIVLLFSFIPGNVYSMTNITDKVEFILTEKVYNANLLTTTVKYHIANNSQNVLISPFRIVITNISNSDAQPINADGITENNYFYYTFHDTTLFPGQSIADFEIEFFNLQNIPFDYAFEVYSNFPSVTKTIANQGKSFSITENNLPLDNIQIQIKNNLLQNNNYILVDHKTEHRPITGDFKKIGPVFEIDSNNKGLKSGIQIKIPYPDKDNDGFIDKTDIREEEIIIIFFDTNKMKWVSLPTTETDYVNNFVFADFSRFGTFALAVKENETSSQIEVFTIDGLSFTKIMAAEASELIENVINVNNIWIPDPLLQAVINLASKSLIWTINQYFEVETIRPYSYTHTGIKDICDLDDSDVNTFLWSGNALDTSNILDELSKQISDNYYDSVTKKIEEGKTPDKYYVVGHSWGTILTYLSLRNCEDNIRPDRIITLSSPEGSSNVNHNSQNSFDLGQIDIPFIPEQYQVLQILINNILNLITIDDIEQVIQGFTNERIDECNLSDADTLNGGDWYNIWMKGDIISGSIYNYDDIPWNINLLDDPDIKNIEWESENHQSRDIHSTPYCHAWSSLDVGTETIEGSWDKYNVSTEHREIAQELIQDLIYYNDNPSGDCGAYVAPGVWKEFDCYNLAAIGKTTNDDPFTPSWRLIGGYWKWGRKGPSSSQWYDTNTEHFAHGPTGPGEDEANEGEISNWNDNCAPDGAWSDKYKTANDPCPAGYRVPSVSQWEGVIDNNTQNTVGTWSTIWGDHTNYSAARFFGDDLMLPAAGRRGPVIWIYAGDSNYGGSLDSRGGGGLYWSSSESGDNAWYLGFDNELATTPSYLFRYLGFSVRCVAE